MKQKRVTSNQLFFSVPYYSPKLKEIVDELKESKEKTDNFSSIILILIN